MLLCHSEVPQCQNYVHAGDSHGWYSTNYMFYGPPIHKFMTPVDCPYKITVCYSIVHGKYYVCSRRDIAKMVLNNNQPINHLKQ